MLEKKPFLIIGFGNQAKAWALNLKDSKQEVVIALRKESPSHEKAQILGFKTVTLQSSDLGHFKFIILLTPDRTHKEILSQNKSYFCPEGTLVFAHGYSYVFEHSKEILPEWEHALLCVKTTGENLRDLYLHKKKILGFMALEENASTQTKFSIEDLGQKLGITLPLINVSFLEETTANLFAEQALHCSLLPHTALYCYNFLRQKGISPELSYLETWSNIKLIADLMMSSGPSGFFNLISDNAFLGSLKGSEQILDDHFKKNIENLYQNIVSGKFYEEAHHMNTTELRQSISQQWNKSELNLIHQKLKGDAL
ncbi:MAG: hypothetical protein KBD63_00520 [Bacteriovoracaceae bacterium]|nr:hypothetical protein [Bacteriovoracaceae bacterium]